jgi:hypothetical protein
MEAGKQKQVSKTKVLPLLWIEHSTSRLEVNFSLALSQVS